MAAKVVLLALALFCAASAAPESRDARIVGGIPVDIEDHPYAAALLYYYRGPARDIQRCVGTIVSSWHVLTSAFCFYNAELENFSVRAGSPNSLSGGSLVKLREYIEHPDYAANPRNNDIAVAFLTTPLGISNTINVVYLPPPGYNIPDGTTLDIVSWGFESETGPQTQFLKAITLDTIPQDQCKEAFAEVDAVAVEDTVLCAARPGFGTCFGDSGAPTTFNNVVVGVASVYHECGTDTYPDVFTRVDRFTTWIMEVATVPGRSSADVDAPRVAY